MAEPSDMIVPLLHEIKSVLIDLRRQTNQRLQELEEGQRDIYSGMPRSRAQLMELTR
jgi:hypothetical protein